MPEFFQSVVQSDVTPSADGVTTIDLQIRPTSHLLITIKALNASVKGTTAAILGALETIEVLQFGATIVSISALDLYALNCVLLGHEPHQENVVDTDNAVRHLTLAVPFGRRLYDPTECFPAVRSGELQLQLTWDIADTGYDGVIEQVQQVELPGANPSRFLTYKTKNYTPSATGDADVDLNIGNTLAGIMFWGTTVPTGTAWTTTLNQLTLLKDNTEAYFSKCHWETLHGQLVERVSPANAFAEKFHTENTAGSYAQNADTAAEEQDDSTISNHAYMDLSPRNVDDYLLDTVGLSSLKLTVNAGDTNASRIIPVELQRV